MKNKCYKLLAVVVMATQFAAVAKAQDSIIWDFQDGTDQGWSTAFGNNDSDLEHPIVDVNGDGNLWMQISTGGFFSDDAGFSGTNDPSFLAAFYGAVNDPSDYVVSFDYIIDTSAGSDGTFFQLGNFFQGGGGSFPFARGPNVELGETDLLGSDIFTGTHSFAIPDGLAGTDELFARFGFSTNGDASDVTISLDNIQIRSLSAVPEPASAGVIGFSLLGLAAIRRRRNSTEKAC